MGMCDDVTEKAWPCSYFIVLRDPVARIVSSYFYCKREPDDMLCASPQLDARNASLREWAVHQRSFLLVSLDTPDPRALGRDAICRIASILQTLSPTTPPLTREGLEYRGYLLVQLAFNVRYCNSPNTRARAGEARWCEGLSNVIAQKPKCLSVGIH